MACSYAILSALYGLGGPDEHTSTARALAVRAIEYNHYWEIVYLFAIGLIKTSVGITILRIAVKRRHRRSVWGVLIFSNVAYGGGVIFLFASCRPLAARWNPLLGTCPGDFLMVPMGYCLMTVGVITDAACALIPIDIVRGLQMPRRLKCTLMVVMSMGLLAAIFSGARYPFCHYFPTTAGRLRKYLVFLISAERHEVRFVWIRWADESLSYAPDDFTWIPIFSTSEGAVGLVFGSLPAIGSTLRLFGSPNKNVRASNSSSARLGNQTFGGTPFHSDMTSKAPLSLTPRGRGQSETRIWSNSGDPEMYGDDIKSFEMPLPEIDT